MSAWQSVPKFIRFAVWLWALAIILSTIAAVLVGVGSLVALLTAAGSM